MLDLFESLAERIRCPRELLPILKKIIPAWKAPVLLFASQNNVTKDLVASRFDLSLAEAEATLERLFCEGLIAREPASIRARHSGWSIGEVLETPGSGQPSYRTRSFYQIANLLLGEGWLQPERLSRPISPEGLLSRAEPISPEELEQLRNFYMNARLRIYDKFLAEKRIPTSSQVITLDEAIPSPDLSRLHRHPHEGITRVTPTSQAIALLQRPGLLTLIPCSCRLTFQRCDQPLETCIQMGDSAEEFLARGVGREITGEEAGEILKIANSRGLVHMAIYAPGMGAYALCSCCECCCHDLQAYKRYGRNNWIARADFIAVDDPEACTGCGRCVKRCVFGARQGASQRDSRPSPGQRPVNYDPSLCYGCGLCVTTCPAGAIKMAPRREKP